MRGVDGEQSQEHDRQFRSIAGGDETVAPVPGSDVVTTLDRGLQYQVEQAVLQRVSALSAYGGTAIVMGVNSGDIYAIANVRQDANGVPQVTSADLAATEPHEPGSVAKVFSISAAVNEGLATPDTTITVPGFLVYRPVNKSDEKWKFKIRDAEPHNDEQMSLRDIIVHSSNIGTVLMTEGLGTLKFGHYLHEFGFGSTTGLGLPDESSGIMKPAADWQATEKVTPRYGYGYAATSLQLIAAVNTIANGGVYVAPRLVLSTIDANGQTHDAPASPTHEVVTPQTAATMTSMMKDVVCYGTAKYAKVPGMSVAGKTGTALLKPTAKPGRTTTRAPTTTAPRRRPLCSRPARPIRRRTPTTRPPTARRSTTRPSSASSRPTTRRSRSSCRSTVPTRPTRTASVARRPGRCSRRWRRLPCTSCASAPHRTTTAARTAQGEPMSRMLREVVEQAGLDRVEVIGDDAEITSVDFDSRQVTDGSLFCCLRGAHSDGHAFAAAARAAGAAALLVDHRLDVALPQVVVADTRRTMGLLAASFFGHPGRALTLVGVTGTNGKTTTTSLIASILTAAGRSTGSIGTLTGAHTTPESPDLQARLAEFVEDGVTAVVMEVSSHALELQRVVGCHFDIAVFTNLGRDHLDLHGTQERYFAAKAKLFQPDLSDGAVVNIDDPHGRLLMDVGAIPTQGFGLADISDVSVSATRHSYVWRGVQIEVPIGGEFNVMNSLAAATACSALGIDLATIATGLRRAPTVPGRFEAVVAGQPFAVIVDYAHTPTGSKRQFGRRVKWPVGLRCTSCSGVVVIGIVRSVR